MISFFPNIIFFLTLLINFFLGFAVFLKSPQKLINRLYFLISLGSSLWIGGLLLLNVTPWNLGGRLSFAGALLAIWFFLWFSLEFPFREKEIPLPILLFGNIFTVIFSFIILLSPLVVQKEVINETAFGVVGKFGVLYPAFGIYFLLLMIGGILNLFHKLKIIKKELERKQLEYFLIGSTLTLGLSSATNLILPLFKGIWQYSKLGPLGTIFLLFFTFLAITRYHLFGIEVILTEILVGVIGILLLVQIFVAPTILWRIVNSGIFVLFCVFGYLLIRGVFREIKRREEVEKIAQRERALREEAERLAQEFQRLDKVKNQFILTTQHHLRTPLSIIKGYLATILGGIYGEIKNQKINQALKNTLLATQRLITLVNEFLDISQFQIGKGALKKEEINLKDVLNEVVLELKPEAEKKKLYLKMIFKAKDLKLKADFQRLKEAFFNLIDNAIKYTQKGGVEIKVESKAPETLLVSIKDTGIGMSKETLSKIFKGLFERGKEAEAVELTGKGIGLFISKTLIDAHGGKIWADSQGPGKGSTFFVELPKK